MSGKFISWNRGFSVDIPYIDEQHQKLIGMLNDLYSAFLERKHQEAAGKIIERLVDYTIEHFSAEEKLLERCNYADIDAHKAEHATFVKQIQVFRDDFSRSKAGLSYKMIVFLQQWLTHHIMEVDKQYMSCMQKLDI